MTRLRPVFMTLLFGLATFAGCNHDNDEAKSPVDAIQKLQSADWEERRHAADELRDDNGPAPQALPYLLAAIQHEQNPKAFGAMMITLGKSGIAEARGIIDPRVNDPDEDMRRWARRALAMWLKRNGLLAEDDELPPPPHPLYQWPPPMPLPPNAPAAQQLQAAPPPPPGAPPPAGAPPPGAAPPPGGAPQPGGRPPGGSPPPGGGSI
jgi:hypothetical protein